MTVKVDSVLKSYGNLKLVADNTVSLMNFLDLFKILTHNEM